MVVSTLNHHKCFTQVSPIYFEHPCYGSTTIINISLYISAGNDIIRQNLTSRHDILTFKVGPRPESLKGQLWANTDSEVVYHFVFRKDVFAKQMNI